MFPCWGSSKTTFNISVQHPAEYTILSNTPMRLISVIKFEKDLDNNNMQWTHFYRTPAMSPFLVSIVVTNFIGYFLHNDNYNATIWCDKGSISTLQFARAIAGNVTLYLEKEWKRLQQFPKVNYLVIPHFQERNDSMTNLGIILYK